MLSQRSGLTLFAISFCLVLGLGCGSRDPEKCKAPNRVEAGERAQDREEPSEKKDDNREASEPAGENAEKTEEGNRETETPEGESSESGHVCLRVANDGRLTLVKDNEEEGSGPISLGEFGKLLARRFEAAPSYLEDSPPAVAYSEETVKVVLKEGPSGEPARIYLGDLACGSGKNGLNRLRSKLGPLAEKNAGPLQLDAAGVVHLEDVLSTIETARSVHSWEPTLGGGADVYDQIPTDLPRLYQTEESLGRFPALAVDIVGDPATPWAKIQAVILTCVSMGLSEIRVGTSLENMQDILIPIDRGMAPSGSGEWGGGFSGGKRGGGFSGKPR